MQAFKKAQAEALSLELYSKYPQLGQEQAEHTLALGGWEEGREWDLEPVCMA